MLPNEELLTRAARDYRRAKDHSKPWRDEAKEAYKFVAGDQLSDDDRRHLEKNKRPVVTFNLIAPNVKAITGMERGNRHEVRYKARERSKLDQYAADIYNQVVKWVFDMNGNETEESEIFRDAAISGMGWGEVRADFTEDPDGMIVTPSIDPLKKLWDPSAKKQNLRDRRFDFTEIDMDKDEFKAFFPDTKVTPKRTVFEGSVEDELEEDPIQENRADNYAGEDDQPGKESVRDKVRVVQYNFYIYEAVFRIHRPDGSNFELSTSKFGEFRKEAEANGVLVIDASQVQQGDAEEGAFIFDKSTRKRFYRAFFTGNEIIEQTPNADPASFTEHCVTGEYDRSTGLWYGIVRAMIDPNRWSNKLFMQILHIVNTNAKGGAFVDKGAFDNFEKAKRDWAKGDALIAVKGNPREKIMERGQGQYPQQLHEIMLYAAGIIPRISGFNLELLGLANKDQPGVLENMRKQAGMTILAAFFDSLKSFRVLKGRTMIHFIRKFISPKRMARIISEEDVPKLEVLKMPGVAKFDVVVEESPQSPNMKAMNFQMLSEMGQTIPHVMEEIFDIVLKQSPLSASIVEEVVDRMKKAKQPKPGVMERMEQEIRKIASETAKNETQAMLNRAKAEATGEKVEIEEFKSESDAASKLLSARAQMVAAENKPGRGGDA